MSGNFASDNNSGVHPRILEAVVRANSGRCPAYGDDRFTQEAIIKFKEVFGRDTDVYFVFNGTGANVAALSALARPYHAVLCSDVAHVYTDECGAPEKHLGAKLIPIPTRDGKLTVEEIARRMTGIGDEHRVQPKVISITQTTELGTVYQDAEVRAITTYARKNDLWVHMDGARLANAAASLGLGLKEATRDLGVDILSFGGTKNGLMGGEAVVFFRPELAAGFKFVRKQTTQLASKMRFISAQFSELLSKDLWLENASRANRMARLLASGIRDLEGVEIVQKVAANAVFARVRPDILQRLREKFFFYTWNETESVVRWMTSFDTAEEEVQEFAAAIREASGATKVKTR